MGRIKAFNGLLSERYPYMLWKEAERSSRKVKRLQRRLDRLKRHCEETDAEGQSDEDIQLKKRMYSAGISYYSSRSEYCHRKATKEFKRQEMIWWRTVYDWKI